MTVERSKRRCFLTLTFLVKQFKLHLADHHHISPWNKNNTTLTIVYRSIKIGIAMATLKASWVGPEKISPNILGLEGFGLS